MPLFSGKSHALRQYCLFVLSLLLLAASAIQAQTTTGLVISGLYGAGGNSGSTFNADYLELFNGSSKAIALDGYAIQYASATGTTISTLSPIASGYTIQPGHFFLIAATPGTGANLPTTPDYTMAAAVPEIAFATAAGKVYLTNSTTKITAVCTTDATSSEIVDFIAYGTTSCAQGTGAAPAPSTTTADIRTAPCTNNADNSKDFTLQTLTASPVIRNSSTTPVSCSGTPGVPTATVAVSAAPSQAAAGASVVLTATVTGSGSTSTPTGTVVFYDNTVQLGTGTSNGGGIWSYTTSTLAVGTHVITASYSGDSVYTTAVAAAASTPATVTITAPAITDFTVAVSNKTITLNGSQKTFTTTVPVVFGPTFTSAVSLSCSGLPSGSRCAFSPATLSKTGNSTLTIAIDNASLQRHSSPFGKGSETFFAFTLLALPLALRRKFRQRFGAAGTMLGLLLLGGLLFTATGCGSNSTPAATSTVTVTATGGGVTHTASFNLIVQ